MIKLKDFLNLIDQDEPITVYDGDNKIYHGLSCKCPNNVREHSYVMKMEFDKHLNKYILDVRYARRDL